MSLAAVAPLQPALLPGEAVTYRRAVRSFVAPEDEVVVPPRPRDRSDRIALAVVAVLVVLAAVTVVMLVRAR